MKALLIIAVLILVSTVAAGQELRDIWVFEEDHVITVLWRPEDVTPLDKDGDGWDDQWDNCPEVVNPEQEDRDQDDLGFMCDNCPEHANPDQEDQDEDGDGDACDRFPQDPRRN